MVGPRPRPARCPTVGRAGPTAATSATSPTTATSASTGSSLPDRTPKPALWEHRALASPVRASADAGAPGEGRITLENRQSFRDLAWLRATWALEADGERVAGGELPLPDVGPGERAGVAIPGWRAPGQDAREWWLTLSFRTREASAWAPAGFEVGWAELAVGGAPGGRRASPAGGEDVVPIDADGRIVHPRLAAPPALTLWRAPTDNDRIGGMAGRWTDWGVDRLERRLDGISREGPTAVVRATWRTAAGHEVAHEQRVTPLADGGLRVHEAVDVPAVLSDLPRVGTVLELVPGHEDLEWFGRGPHEAYPDRRRGARVGRWRTTVTEALTPYVRPQETGGRADVRWLALRAADGSGIRIRLDAPRQASALHVRAADLAAVAHDIDVRTCPETIVTLDAVHRGLGTASCGPDTLPPYLVPTGRHEWSWTLEPLAPAQAPGR